MDKITMRVSAAVLLAFLLFAGSPAAAQAPLQGTQIIMGAPAQSTAGSELTVQAVLADSQGHPISKAVIYFTSRSSFLGDTGDVVLAQAVTNAQGQAVAHFADDFSGDFTLSAEFRGDSQFAPCSTGIQISTAPGSQVYVEHIGVDIPGFNVPPVAVPRASLGLSQPPVAAFIQGLWPAMNGWPVAAVLLLVWSMYLLAVTFVLRLAASADDADERQGRSL